MSFCHYLIMKKKFFCANQSQYSFLESPSHCEIHAVADIMS